MLKRIAQLCVVLMALLTPAALAVDFAGGGEFTVDYVLDDWNNIYDATVSFEDGSSLPDGKQFNGTRWPHGPGISGIW